MTKRSKNLTPEDLARRAETRRKLQERIAYHAAKAKEEEEAQARRSD